MDEPKNSPLNVGIGRISKLSDDEDSRPLSALVIDESRKEMTGGEETSSQGSSPRRRKKKLTRKPKKSVDFALSFNFFGEFLNFIVFAAAEELMKKPKSPKVESLQNSKNSPRTSIESQTRTTPSSAITRSSFKNFRGGKKKRRRFSKVKS